MEKVIKFNLNGKIVEITLDRDYTLLWALRNQFGITGTKYGCGIGYCGSCTVLVDKIPVRSCNVPVSDVEGKNVVTIEGLSSNGKLHFLQQAFVDNDALQCGYCTPGMILAAYGLLSGNPSPTYEEIVEGMEDNLCRCGSHVRVIKAIQTASEEMKGGKKL